MDALLLDSRHPLLHFVLARCRWLLHFHPLTTPPTPDGYRDEDHLTEGWYRMTAKPPWRPVDLYVYLSPHLGLTLDHAPADVAADEIRSLERPLTAVTDSEMWTRTWHWAYILEHDIASQVGADFSGLDAMAAGIEKIWTQSETDLADGKAKRMRALRGAALEAVTLARGGEIDDVLFFSGARDVVDDYLRCRCSGLEAAEVLTDGIQKYIGAVESGTPGRLRLLEDAIGHIADVVSDLVESRATSTVDEYEYRSYLASLYVRIGQRLITHEMVPGWSPEVRTRLRLLRSNLDEIFAHDLAPGLRFAARWRPKEAFHQIVATLEGSQGYARDVSAAPPKFVATVREIVAGRSGSIGELGGMVSLGGPPGFDPLELCLWMMYGARAGTGVTRFEAQLGDDVHPVSAELRAAGEEFLRRIHRSQDDASM